jgi:hypothetical protein
MTHTIMGQDPFTTGYVWNNQISNPSCFNPSSPYSYNSRGALNSICRSSVGVYTVHFADLANGGGNVQVTAYGSTASNCKVGGWGPSGNELLVTVRCFTVGGAPKDANFTASFAGGGGAGNTIAWLWAHDPTAASYTPASTYQYNNRGGLGTVTRNGIGNYSVRFPDSFGAAAAGNVKATAYGFTSGVCKVGGWGPIAGNTAEQVNVLCFTSAGAASDELFSVVYVNGMNILGDNVMATAYAWANSPSSASYTPVLQYQRSTTLSHSGTVTITRAGVGSYDVFLPFQNEGLDGGHVQVTAYGGGTNRCQVGFWGSAAGGRSAHVYCFNNAGVLADSFYDIEYTARIQ